MCCNLLHFRGSNAYKEFRAVLQKEGDHTWLVEALDKTDVSSASSSSSSSITPIKGRFFGNLFLLTLHL